MLSTNFLNVEEKILLYNKMLKESTVKCLYEIFIIK